MITNYFRDINAGDTRLSRAGTITEAGLASFATSSGDWRAERITWSARSEQR